MRKYLQIVDRHRASKGTRFANYLIDLVAFYIFFFVILMIVMTISPAYREWLANSSDLAQRLMGIITYILFSFLMETVTGGRSLGKLITGTRVIMIDGQKPSVGNYFLRNIIRGIILVDQLSFLGENGFHDNWSNTRVINIKDYEAERQLKSDINSIGAKEII
ncbi:RDD family protein [Chryseobacterium shigense]|uniref:Putative RDD family membrane protein YckC n=1 Tax=Chryseobacterium shigense TaxID=297244 RepID=A0A841N4H2_9FLAO|nr:RDD family protein [Chryseobacterium shigense]MBB6372016.1 putative RDD family membrane protein YckC [Chryseobacterium shigense]